MKSRSSRKSKNKKRGMSGMNGKSGKRQPKVRHPGGGIPKLSEETWQAVQILLWHGVENMKTEESNNYKLLNKTQ